MMMIIIIITIIIIIIKKDMSCFIIIIIMIIIQSIWRSHTLYILKCLCKLQKSHCRPGRVVNKLLTTLLALLLISWSSRFITWHRQINYTVRLVDITVTLCNATRQVMKMEPTKAGCQNSHHPGACSQLDDAFPRQLHRLFPEVAAQQ